MYRKPHVNQLAFEDFVLPFGGKLRSDNRWVILAKQIPWAAVEAAYAQQFSQEDLGSPAKSSRLALGALILKERLGVTDRELVEQIAENPYLQYFLGHMAYQEEAPFHHSLLTTFRKRFGHESLGTINDAIARLIANAQPTKEEPVEEQGADEPSPPKGQLLVDATCVPADMKYPTDLHLLHDAREKTEEIIDHLHAGRATPKKKPRTYRQNARRAYICASPKPNSWGERNSGKVLANSSGISGVIWVRLLAWPRKGCSLPYPPSATASCSSFKNCIGSSSGCIRTAVIASPIGWSASVSLMSGLSCEAKPGARSNLAPKSPSVSWMGSVLWIGSVGMPTTNRWI